MKKRNKNVKGNIVYLACVFFVSLICLVLVNYIAANGEFRDPLFMFTIYFILIPLASFIYARKFIPKDNKIKKWLLSVVCPIISFASCVTLSILLAHVEIIKGARYDFDYLIYKISFRCFCLCMLASLLGLINYEKLKEFIENKKYLYCLCMPIINWLLLSFGLPVVDYISGNDWGAIGLFLAFFGFCSLVAAPVMSILYCRRIRTLGWPKYLCCIDNAVAMGLYSRAYCRDKYVGGGDYLGSSNIESLTEMFENSIAPPIFLPVFIPALICGLATFYDVTKRKTEDASLS